MQRIFLLVSLSLCGVLLIIGLGQAGGASASARPALRSESVETISSTESRYLPMVAKYYDPSYVSPFGIVMYGNITDSLGLEKMRQAGSQWVVTDVSWANVQPTENGPYNWVPVDAMFANAEAAGMQVFVLFSGNPTWVTPGWRGVVPPDKMAALKAVIQAMAERYDGTHGYPRVDYWSFYSEPDFHTSWGYYGAEYAAMLAEVAPLVHAANPNANVLIGGIAYDYFTDDEIPGHPKVFVRRFLTDTLQALNTYPGGALNYIDAFAFHYYPISPSRWPTLREKTAELRGILARHGVGQLPMFVPEISKPSTWPPGDTPTHQGQWLVQTFVRGLADGIVQLAWFQVFDIPDDPGTTADDLSRTQGLFVERDLNQPRPAYFAYQVLARELDRARYVNSLNLPGVEGYVFTLDGRLKTVAWGTGSTAAPIDFAQTCARRVDMLGVTNTVSDGGAGDLDQAVSGQIRLAVTPNEPIYVGACP